MIDVSLTQFVDFVMKSGSPKLTAVRKIKREKEVGYHPSRDFYRKLRDGIVGHHKAGRPKDELDALAACVADKNKALAYPLIMQGYKRFLGRKEVSWIEPCRRDWHHGQLVVSVNPELGLEIDGEPYLIKMYFKKDQPSKLQVAGILHLMQLTLHSNTDPRCLALLDVRRGHLMPASVFDRMQTLLLQGEADAFLRMYRGL